jgi:hypothetical protein
VHDGRHSRLLILSCSKSKRQSTPLLPAIDRYDGPAFKTFRKWRPINDRIEVIILSAKYGFIPSHLPIPDYDHVMPRQVTPEQKFHYCEQIKELLTEREFDTAFINLGKNYASCLTALEEIPIKVGEVVSACGRIGQRLHQLKSWLTVGRVADSRRGQV